MYISCQISLESGILGKYRNYLHTLTFYIHIHTRPRIKYVKPSTLQKKTQPCLLFKKRKSVTFQISQHNAHTIQ